MSLKTAILTLNELKITLTNRRALILTAFFQNESLTVNQLVALGHPRSSANRTLSLFCDAGVIYRTTDSYQLTSVYRDNSLETLQTDLEQTKNRLQSLMGDFNASLEINKLLFEEYKQQVFELDKKLTLITVENFVEHLQQAQKKLEGSKKGIFDLLKLRPFSV